jgi:hypothetical protein
VSTYHTHNFSAQTGGHSNDHVHNGSTDVAGDHTHASNIGWGIGGTIGNWASECTHEGTVYQTNAAGAHAHIINTNGVSADHSHAVSGATDAQGEHTHTFTTAAAGGGAAFGITPPYYALAYIMKL